MIGANVRTNLSGVHAKGPLIKKRVVVVLTEKVRFDCNPYVPFLTGALRGTAERYSTPGKVVWGGTKDVPYARAQYYGLPGKTHPGTVMQWFDYARPRYRAEWERSAKEAAREVANGL